jgi:hypothetical protein
MQINSCNRPVEIKFDPDSDLLDGIEIIQTGVQNEIAVKNELIDKC